MFHNPHTGNLTVLIKVLWIIFFNTLFSHLHLLSPGTGSSILSALQDLPLAFWPCRSKMEKHLQVISVLQWVISFLALGELVSVFV